MHEGYSVSGTYIGGHTVTFEYCNDVVTMIADGTRDGTFSLEVNDVNMYFPNDNINAEEYRYIAADVIGPGVYILITGEIYETYDHGDLTITNISTINCELLPQ